MGDGIMSVKDVESFIAAGADIILVPAPGTVPGITVEAVKDMADLAHKKGAMMMTTIGTSQEGSDTDTIKSIALNCKMAGADIHHIGDAGYTGIAVPENITAYSVAIRGRRHTYRRMAMKD
jgi:dihydroorotate dehydrogenase